MNYVAYKMEFPNGIHLGKTSIEESEFTFAADTLFSALCQEALRFGEDKLQTLYTKVKNGALCFSDALPCIGDAMYVPKPMLKIETGETGDSRVKKAYKKLSYIPVRELEGYLKGVLDICAEKERFDKFGSAYTQTSAAVRGQEETNPYRLGVYRYAKENGLYIIIGYGQEEDHSFVKMLLESLSYSGIGGRRHSGLGRFELSAVAMPEILTERLEKSGEKYMTLSVSLPTESELPGVVCDAQYSLIKRSGFVASFDYADEFLRKQDLFVFAAGACVTKKYNGDVYDVASGGRHPVYRYAKPIFLEVSI